MIPPPSWLKKLPVSTEQPQLLLSRFPPPGQTMPRTADLQSKSCYGAFQWNADSSSFNLQERPSSLHRSLLADPQGIYASVFGTPSMLQRPQWARPTIPRRPMGSRVAARCEPWFTPAGTVLRALPRHGPSAAEVESYQKKPPNARSATAARPQGPAAPATAPAEDLPQRQVFWRPRESKTGFQRRRKTNNEKREDALRKWEVIADRMGRENSEVVADFDKCKTEDEVHGMIFDAFYQGSWSTCAKRAGAMGLYVRWCDSVNQSLPNDCAQSVQVLCRAAGRGGTGNTGRLLPQRREICHATPEDQQCTRDLRRRPSQGSHVPVR